MPAEIKLLQRSGMDIFHFVCLTYFFTWLCLLLAGKLKKRRGFVTWILEAEAATGDRYVVVSIDIKGQDVHSSCIGKLGSKYNVVRSPITSYLVFKNRNGGPRDSASKFSKLTSTCIAKRNVSNT